MHAIEVAETGGPEVLTYVEKAQPTPGPGQVLIKAEAIGVNFIDTYFRSGLYPREVPFVVGNEVCGTIAAVGPDVAALNVGDRVVTRQATGAYAEYASHQPISLRTCPMRWPPTRRIRAAEGYDGALSDQVGVPDAARGHGAGARRRGRSRADPDPVGHQLGTKVITTVSTPEKAELSRQAGAVEVLDYPDDPAEFGARIRDLTDGHGVAAVYDGVGKTHLRRQPGQPRGPRHAGAVRRGQRPGSAGGPAATQRRRVGVPDPAQRWRTTPARPTSSLGGQAK